MPRRTGKAKSTMKNTVDISELIQLLRESQNTRWRPQAIPPTFQGSLDEDPVSFLETMEKFLQEAEEPEIHYIQAVGEQLVGEAKTWFHMYDKSSLSWNLFQHIFLKHFDSSVVKTRISSIFFSEVQDRHESGMKFVSRKFALWKRIKNTLPLEIALSSAISNMHTEYRLVMVRHKNIKTFEELLDFLADIDGDIQDLRETEERNSRYNYRKSYQSPQRNDTFSSTRYVSKKSKMTDYRPSYREKRSGKSKRVAAPREVNIHDEDTAQQDSHHSTPVICMISEPTMPTSSAIFEPEQTRPLIDIVPDQNCSHCDPESVENGTESDVVPAAVKDEDMIDSSIVPSADEAEDLDEPFTDIDVNSSVDTGENLEIDNTNFVDDNTAENVANVVDSWNNEEEVKPSENISKKVKCHGTATDLVSDAEPNDANVSVEKETENTLTEEDTKSIILTLVKSDDVVLKKNKEKAISKIKDQKNNTTAKSESVHVRKLKEKSTSGSPHKLKTNTVPKRRMKKTVANSESIGLKLFSQIHGFGTNERHKRSSSKPIPSGPGPPFKNHLFGLQRRTA